MRRRGREGFSLRGALAPQRQALILGLLSSCAFAHVVSMSSGDLTIDGTRARYELRMPLYEVAHVPNPGRTLLDHIHFGNSRMVGHSCQEDPARQLYICKAEYDFSAPVDHVDVDCTFAAITVPTHVHMLRAGMGDKHDQAMFDSSFTHVNLRFRPPTPTEIAAGEAGAGFLRALGGAVQILFLAALALASRTRKELLALTGMFLAGQIASALIVPHTSWQPSARFVEAAAALTIAYLSVEILLLPAAGARWMVAGVLVAFHGLYFFLFLETSGYRPLFVLTGAAAAEIVAIAILALILSRLARLVQFLHPVQVSASALLVFGMVWFIARLRS